MPDAMKAARVMGLSEIADEFRRLDGRRRKQGLSLGEAERYNTLFAQLSDHLASYERHRKVDVRQFLRVRSRMELIIRTGATEVRAVCHDFGGGGCAVSCPTLFHLDDDVWLDGAVIEGTRYPLHGRSVIAWTRLPSAGGKVHGYGLKFAIDSPKMRDEVDRLLYRVLDAFLAGDESRPHVVAL